eukprot:TRINITY_DN24729_c0_g1_i2.p1 TRINITY_DN24729_c0_g1~~TRINITY_DN24729_c0_g1_i2.p1  ORF type:complete len:188 (+),score=21.84 TRINITY_DN24729_c0_g1_i2:26-565(+)
MARGSNIGNLLTYAGTATGAITIIEGLIYLYWKPPSFLLLWRTCYFEDPNDYTYWTDCNSQWAANWGFLSVQARYQPLIWGIVAALIPCPGLLAVIGFPKNFFQYGIFLAIKGVFGDLGYCGKLGVANGFFSIGLGLVMMVAAAFHVKSTRMIQLESKGYEQESVLQQEDASEEDSGKE